ncbi:MAG TPA: DUF1289 domain-containing protein [Rheinheimera sp.]|uniref:DUF1289 domain-containing protein n=1 Tax=Rheinheimera sp. TaxID=1869214 RepID=UPI002F9222EB
MSESPCVRNCCLDQQDCCIGCGRSLLDIMEWHTASTERRAQIVQLAARRQQQRADLQIIRRRVVNPSE